ncbi:MAG: benzoyl-CoA-dihydrodiol lyase, partial [Alphaproteobacteria bacterium]|nr:benzoyl-CoA-dihydrodiol lyase [Alphaproteobacteria bacterium]
VDWKLVDEVVPKSKMADAVAKRARELAARTDRPAAASGIELTELSREVNEDGVEYDHLTLKFDRANNVVNITVRAPSEPVPQSPAEIHAAGTAFWPLAVARQLDDAILHLRANEQALGLWVVRTEGDPDLVAQADHVLADNAGDWLVREVTLYLKRVFKRIDVTSRSVIAMVEPGSCFTGTLAELLFTADRSFMLDGVLEGDNRPATVRLTEMNFGAYPMCNDLTRLETRFLDDAKSVEAVRAKIGADLTAAEAEALGLVTFAPDDIDWGDEVRIAIEERASLSADALTGMEASLRFAGPETLETKIFGRLTAWQNWIFQRPNAVGEEGALKLFGTGKRPAFDENRV